MSHPPLSRAEIDARYLRIIATFNLVKGFILLVFAVGILRLLNKDVDVIVAHWMSVLRFDLENRHIAALLEKLDLVTNRQIKQVSGFGGFYAALFLTEGVGLLLRQRWAKYFTIVVTGSFIPLEVFESFHHFGFPLLAVLATNLFIVAFLIRNVRRDAVYVALANVEASPPPALEVAK